MRGITIILNNERIHTGKDWDLVQEKKEIGNPEIQSYLVQVPGRNGLLNLTKGLTGNVCYNNRPLSFQYFGTGTNSELLELIDTVNRYHGETIQIIDDDTPDYYYEGECSIDIDRKPNYVTITLEVDANPFKVKNNQTVLTVNLTSDVQSISTVNKGVPVMPLFTVSNTATISKDNATVTLSAGTYEVNDIEVKRGANIFDVSGNGTLTITYREAII